VISKLLETNKYNHINPIMLIFYVLKFGTKMNFNLTLKFKY